ncbi:hypothetical protein E3A20_09900, partial [Planctomyces bekefii]
MATITPALETHGHEHDHAHGHHEQTFIQKYVFSTDHKVIGIQFLITTLLMLMVGGALALAVRWQLAFPWENMPIVGKLFGVFNWIGTIWDGNIQFNAVFLNCAAFVALFIV